MISQESDSADDIVGEKPPEHTEKSDFVDDIIGDKLPEHTIPPPLLDKFLPWHRVRKEFIRRYQWNELAIRMAKRRWRQQLQHEESEWSLDDDTPEKAELPADILVERPLRCLVIPGQDLLDLRALWRDMRQFNCFIRYLGFNEGHGSDQEGTRLHVANNAVTSLHQIANDSYVANDRFESIAKPNSQALRYMAVRAFMATSGSGVLIA